MIDLLIIGSGAAGLSAALDAHALGANVLVVSKTFPTHSASCQAQGGMNAVLKDEDSIDSHVQDTFKSSHGLANTQSIYYMSSVSKETIDWLDRLGVPFSRDENNQIAQRQMGGASHKRVCYSSDYTGLKILHTLYDTCLKAGVSFYNEWMLLNLIKEDNRIIGATFLEIQTGMVKEILAKTTILATGGYTAMYSGFNTNSVATTGDGIAAALRAQATLSNMEFIQFHPTAISNTNALMSESARGEGGYLIDKKGNRFVDELQSRDVVSRAIYEKMEQGDEVFLDLRHLGLEHINKTMPQERRLALEFAGVKIEEEPIKINPAAHYCMGGILVNTQCQTNLKGLYACGECAQTNVHGANRLGGNSLLEVIAFAKKAAKEACNEAKALHIESKQQPSKQFISDNAFIQAVFHFPNKIDFYEQKSFMGKILYKNVGLFRNDLNMKAVLSKIRQWQKEFPFMGIGDKNKAYNKNLVEFIEFGNLLELSEVVVVGAISRCESRGAHFRTDHPKEHESFAKNSVAYKNEGILALDFEKVEV
jgi:succinate dehydrogenase / fumarate reductase flavoprotein subunit